MSELRHDPVHRRWVVIALERATRPGEFSFPPPIPDDDEPPCDFCPGNESATPPEIAAVRDGGGANAPNWIVRAVPNRRPILAVEGTPDRSGVGQYDRMRGIGAHEIIVETPDHRAKPWEIPVLQQSAAFSLSRARMADLSRDTRFKHILLHKNYGVDAGASVHHPVHQIIAIPITPRRISTQLDSACAHYRLKERCLFCDLLVQEIDDGSRLVHICDDFVSYCPYASRFPYEVHVYPRRHMHSFIELDERHTERFTAHFLEVLRRIHVVLGDVPFNWNLVNAPNTKAGVRREGYWRTLEHDFHWHIELLPRLTPQAGFEWGTGLFINPTPPEDAAAFLRDAG